MQTALNIPESTGLMDLDKQAEMYAERIDIADFKDPDKLDKFIVRFTAQWEMANSSANSAASSPAMLFGGASTRRELERTREPAEFEVRGNLMQPGLYVSLSGQLALMRRLDSIANNVANTNTAGFRAEKIKFEELVSPKTREPRPSRPPAKPTFRVKAAISSKPTIRTMSQSTATPGSPSKRLPAPSTRATAACA